MTDTMEVSDAEIDAVLSGADSEAPFGRFKNGKPRKRPAAAGQIPSVPAPRKQPPRSGSSSSARRGMPDYEQLAKNALQIPVIVLSVTGSTLQAVGRAQLGTSVALDGMTIGLYTDQLADVGRRMAESDSTVGRWLERFGKGGVHAEAISLGLTIGCQMLVNHGRMAPMPAAGLLAPQEVFDRAQAMVGGSPAGAAAAPADAEPADAVPDR